MTEFLQPQPCSAPSPSPSVPTWILPSSSRSSLLPPSLQAPQHLALPLCSRSALFVSTFHSIFQSPLSAILSLFLGCCAEMGTELLVLQCIRALVPAGLWAAWGWGWGCPALKNAPVCPRAPGNCCTGSLLAFSRVFVECLGLSSAENRSAFLWPPARPRAGMEHQLPFILPKMVVGQEPLL